MLQVKKIANASEWSHLGLLDLDEGRTKKRSRNRGAGTLNVFVDLENRREVPDA
jgi:hypothetical protein